MPLWEWGLSQVRLEGSNGIKGGGQSVAISTSWPLWCVTPLPWWIQEAERFCFLKVFGHSVRKCLTKAQGLFVTNSVLRLASALCLLPGVQVCITMPCRLLLCIKRQPQSTFEWRIGILYIYMQKYRNLNYSPSIAEGLYFSISPLERYITSLPLPFSRGQQRSLKEFS